MTQNTFRKEKSVNLQLLDFEHIGDIFGFSKEQSKEMAQLIADKLEETPNLLDVIKWLLDNYNDNELIYQLIQFGATLWVSNFLIKPKPPVMAS